MHHELHINRIIQIVLLGCGPQMYTEKIIRKKDIDDVWYLNVNYGNHLKPL